MTILKTETLVKHTGGYYRRIQWPWPYRKVVWYEINDTNSVVVRIISDTEYIEILDKAYAIAIQPQEEEPLP